MHNIKRITNDLYWVGGNDRRLAMFEGVYDVPTGVSYNSYLLLDDEVVLFDTVDKAVQEIFFENIEFLLKGAQYHYRSGGTQMGRFTSSSSTSDRSAS